MENTGPLILKGGDPDGALISWLTWGECPASRFRQWCQTAPCVLSRKLLVTVGAAAPVIALAAVVSLTDILGSRRFFVIASLPDLLPSRKDDRALYTRAVIARGSGEAGWHTLQCSPIWPCKQPF